MQRIVVALVAVFIGSILIGCLVVSWQVGSLRTSRSYEPDGAESQRPIGLQGVALLVLSELSPLPVLCIVVSEDHRFAQHSGFDRHELQNALRAKLLRGESLRGASTITQQLARTAFLSGERSVSRKLLEALYAHQLERVYTKSEILSLYLQTVHLGAGLFGLQEASRAYFGKDASALTLEDSIVLASLLPNPRARGQALLGGDWTPELEQAVIRRAVTVHAVLWGLEQSGVGMPATGEGVLELPLARILAAGITPDDRLEIAPRLWASMEKIHGSDVASGALPAP